MIRAVMGVPFLLAMLAATTCVAQTDACLERTFFANVADYNGNPVPQVPKENFRAKLHGKPVEFLEVAEKELVPRVVILIDQSGSMSSGSYVAENVSGLIGVLLHTVSQDAPIAIVTFAEKPSLLHDFTTDRGELVAALEKPLQAFRKESQGQTAMLDSIAFALDLFAEPHPGDTLFVITDGGDNHSRAFTEGKLHERVRRSRVRIFFAVLDTTFPKGRATPEEIRGPYTAAEISDATGGRTFMFPVESLKSRDNVKNLVATAQALMWRMTHVY